MINMTCVQYVFEIDSHNDIIYKIIPKKSIKCAILNLNQYAYFLYACNDDILNELLTSKKLLVLIEDLNTQYISTITYKISDTNIYTLCYKDIKSDDIYLFPNRKLTNNYSRVDMIVELLILYDTLLKQHNKDEKQCVVKKRKRKK